METHIVKKIKQKEYMKNWRIENKEKKKELNKKWKKANPEKVKINAKKYREKHKEQKKEYMKEYEQRPDVKELRKEYHKKWYKENREKELIRSKKWKEENPARFRELKHKAQKKYYQKYPEKIKAQGVAKYCIPLRNNCQICNNKNKLERHHWRYDKPLMVSTLCKPCHTIQHNKIRGGV